MSMPTIVNLEEVPLNDAFPSENKQTGTLPKKARGAKWTCIGPMIGAEKLGCALPARRNFRPLSAGRSGGASAARPGSPPPCS